MDHIHRGLPVLDPSIGEGEYARNNAPIALLFSHVYGGISYIYTAATCEEAAENTSAKWLRFVDLEMRSCSAS